jgi:hypothetical protein
VNKMQIKAVTVTVPAGEYWLGDPCYSFDSQETWMELLNSCDFFRDPIGTVVVGGKTFQVLGFGTAHGDGVYRDQEGHEYGVDAGLIGLVPVEVNPDAARDLCRNVVFTRPTECSSVNGYMEFGRYIINTDTWNEYNTTPEGDYDEDEDEDDDSTAAVDPWADEDEDQDA